MNIEGVNLSSLLPGNSAIEGGARSLPENGATPEDFSNALMGQIGLLSEAGGQVELPEQLQSMTMSQTVDNTNNLDDLLKQKGDGEELAALFDKYLPLSSEKNEATDLNETVDLEATLLALTDALKSITPGMTADEVATAQNMNDVMASNGFSFVKPLPEEAKSNILGEEDVLSGIEQAAPGITSDMIPLPKQIDNRTDNPVITRPLTHPGWSQDLGEQIVWMNNKAIPAAEIKLNPAHLGPISVRIDINQDQATILFTAQHAEVKDAIEASLPRLREMLGSQQLNLINVNISQNSTPDQGRSHSQTFSNTPENREQGIEGVADTIEDRVVVSKGLLSLYA